MASAEFSQVLEMIADMGMQAAKADEASRTQVLRDVMDSGFGKLPVEAEQLGVTITPVDANGTKAEWVIAPNSDPNRRLLYIHGGAYTMGSAKSHRPITAQIAKDAGVSVLSLDYRLMPEHPRMAGIEDCRNAYRFIRENGPGGAGDASAVFVAGDSAGGNLTLTTIAWARDESIGATAAIAIAPATDSTMGQASWRANVQTDYLLGPMASQLLAFDNDQLIAIQQATTGIDPKDPIVSPLFGDLAGLPPILVHASEIECLYDDAVKYVEKAQQAGIDATLYSAPDMVHVWHWFAPVLPEARQAIKDIAAFLNKH